MPARDAIEQARNEVKTSPTHVKKLPSTPAGAGVLIGCMTLLLALLLLDAPDDPVESDQVPEFVQLVVAGESSKALALLKEIGGHKENHTEAKSLVKLIRTGKPALAPEMQEALFLALRGIGSRKATKDLLALLKHSTLKKEVEIRLGVCRALAGSADPAAVDALIDRLRDVDDTVIAAAAEACASYRYAQEEVRKELFQTVCDLYESTWNQKNSVSPDPKDKVGKVKAERRWEIVEAPMERALQLLSNASENDPPSWRRWWNKNKNSRWGDIER